MFENVLRGDFEGWHGLPEGTDLDSILAALRPLDSVAPPVERVRGVRRFLVVDVTRTLAPRNVEIWCDIDGRTVLAVDIDHPGIDPAQLAMQLGPPELTLPDRRFASGGLAIEHVYASRGVTASVVEPFDPGAPRRVDFLQLYAAMSTAGYLTEVGVAEHARPHP